MSSAAIFARLLAHWPQLGGNDDLAAIRAQDWTRVIGRSDPRVAEQVCVELVEGWGGSYPPKLADWQEYARRVAARMLRPELPALDGPIVDPKCLDVVAEAAEKLRLRRAEAHALEPKVDKGERGPVDPNGHMPSYEELYGPEPADA